MVDPLDALNAFQEDIDRGLVPLEICQSNSNYHYVLDVVRGKNRFSCFEIRHGVIAAYVGLVNVGAELGVQRFQIGYAVIEQERNKGLGAAIVNTSITELLRVAQGFGVCQVCIEAVVALDNIHSINLSKKCINSEYKEIIDHYSGELALYFKSFREAVN